MTWLEPSELSDCFRTWSAAMVLYARQWLDQAAAEDAVQDVFLALVSHHRRPVNLRAYLFRSVRNAAISRTRSLSRRQSHEQRAAVDRPGWFQARPDDLIDARAAQDALTRLPDQQRELLILKIWGGLTFDEIGTVTNDPTSTLFSRYKSALASLRRMMEDRPCETTNP
ncbi:MAG: sigma-70 family RNA polymerase sigma factor [Phycisphaerae bacterium]|nr:sigma-70 family RNA polymerase sigma factor [Phycisphaerae bacterium]